MGFRPTEKNKETTPGPATYATPPGYKQRNMTIACKYRDPSPPDIPGPGAYMPYSPGN